jgi:Phage minor capsid protein 2
MLTAAQFDELSVPIVNLYNDFADTVILDIARRLIKIGNPTATAAWQLNRLQQAGMLYQDIIRELSKMTGQSEAVLRQTFEQAGVTAMRFDDAIYKAAGLKPLPLNFSPQMLNVLRAGLEKTGGVLRNLTMTTAQASQTQFLQALDLAYTQTITGAFSYDQAIRAAIKSVGESGLSVVYPTGYRMKLDAAVRMNVLTGVSQTAGQLQWNRADEMGQDLVQVSQHIGARPSHQLWQGGIYSRSGTDPDYPDFVSSTGYGTGEGLLGWN